MYTAGRDGGEGMGVHRDCLAVVLGENVLEDLLRLQWTAVAVVAEKPQPWRLVVLVVRYGQIVRPELGRPDGVRIGEHETRGGGWEYLYPEE